MGDQSRVTMFVVATRLGLSREKPLKISNCEDLDDVCKLVRSQCKYLLSTSNSTSKEVQQQREAAVLKLVEEAKKDATADLTGYLNSCHGSKSSDDGDDENDKRGGAGTQPRKSAGQPARQEAATPLIKVKGKQGEGANKGLLGASFEGVRSGAFAPQKMLRDSPRSAAQLDPAVLEICEAESDMVQMSESDRECFIKMLVAEGVTSLEELFHLCQVARKDLAAVLRDSARAQHRQMTIGGKLKLVTVVQSITSKKAGTQWQ